MFTDNEFEKEPTPQAKFTTLKLLIPDAHNNPNLVITGSLAQVISDQEVEGTCHLEASHLGKVNDIDVMALTYEHGRYDKIAQNASRSGVSVECKVPQIHCYSTIKGQELSEKTINLDVGDTEYIPCQGFYPPSTFF